VATSLSPRIVLSRGHQNLIANFDSAKINADVAREICSECCAAITYSKSGNRSRSLAVRQPSIIGSRRHKLCGVLSDRPRRGPGTVAAQLGAVKRPNETTMSLEQTIAALVERKYELPERSAARRLSQNPVEPAQTAAKLATPIRLAVDTKLPPYKRKPRKSPGL